MTKSQSYDETFYEVIKAGCLSSARAVVPRVMDLLGPKTVIDLGCGEGWWLSVFKEHGARVVGVDGDYVNRDRLAIDSGEFIAHDLASRRFNRDGKHRRNDLAVSLEVAEHLPPERADSFVDDLCSLADVVLFSAAIPGQGGTGHQNEQWPGYWVEKFDRRGYMCSGALRWEFWANDDVENWYRANTLMFATPDAVIEHDLAWFFEQPTAFPFSVVHPVLYDARRR